ncbi:MAG: hypothetical protein IT372_07945, partial [Polyangiaceae bacterium]|nr:hypothetical protein [Polyangiaceae bacterium]
MRPPHRFLHVCQAWIIPGEKICGAPAMPGVSWCEAHPDPLGVEAQERAWDEAAR